MAEKRNLSERQVPDPFLGRLLSHFRARKVLGYLRDDMVLCDLGCRYERSNLERLSKYYQKGIGHEISVTRDRHSPKYLPIFLVFEKTYFNLGERN
jgi:hypothetical protein